MSDASRGVAHERFAEGRFLGNRHTQTLAVALPVFTAPKGVRLPRTTEIRVPLEGGALLLHAWFHDAEAPGKPAAAPRKTAVIAHGVGGSSASTYVLRASVALFASGYNVVRVNLRGAGESVALAPSLYHGGLTEDLARVLAALRGDARVGPVVVLGFSLGGNMVLKAAGEWGDAPPEGVVGVATVSAPMNLLDTSTWLESRETLPYRLYVLKSMIEQAIRFRSLHPDRATTYTRRSMLRVRTLADYDDRVVAPMHGFGDARGYYAAAASGPYVARIRVPTRIVHAADDPMVPLHTLLPFTRDLPDNVKLVVSEHGGHVAFFRAWQESAFVKSWAVERLLPFFDEITASR